jgi:hypothetical protein
VSFESDILDMGRDHMRKTHGKKTIVSATAVAAGASSDEAKGASLWTSAMVKHPEQVQALGMLAVEIAEMELRLSHLLGRLVRSTTKIGEALYFTPRANMLRLELITNIAPLVLQRNKPKLIAVQNVAKRAQTIMGKRHELIHNRFIVTGLGIETVRYEKGIAKESPLDKNRLSRLVDDVRILNVRIIDLIDYDKKVAWLSTSP